MGARAKERDGHVDGRGIVAQRLDRRTGGDATIEREAEGLRLVGSLDGARQGDAIGAYDLRHEALAAVCHAVGATGIEERGDVGGGQGRRLGELQNLQGAGAMGQPTKEAPLLQPGDQAMDA